MYHNSTLSMSISISRIKKTKCVLASILVITGTCSAQSLLNGMRNMTKNNKAITYY